MDLDPHSLFRDIDASRGLVVAVSGGGDSLALLLLLHDFLSRHRPAARLHAVTVDHALRAGSAGEARAVAALCAARGIAHRTVAWQGDKPATGLSAAAREARYRLLADAAADLGVAIVLTGHTLDDQAETLAMRAARGGGTGLAGMARATLFDGRAWIVRPLLHLRRRALRDWLAAHGVAWIDDPTNENPAFERARVRKALSEADVEGLAGTARSAGRARRALADEAATLLDRFAGAPAPGLLRLDPAFAGQAAALPALRACLAAAGGTPRLPDAARTGALLARLAEGAPLRATLSRAVVDARRGGIFILREARDLPVATAGPGTDLLWDGRFRVAVPTGAGTWTVGPEGLGEEDDRDRDGAGAPRSLVRAARASGPVLRPAGAAGAVTPAVTPVVAPWARFLPEFDLAPAAALGRILGAPALPLAPWKHHIGAEP